jgi:hypothetical protein
MTDSKPIPNVHVRKPPRHRPAPRPVYVYHWDRIFGALMALVLLLGLVGYGIYTWLGPSPEVARGGGTATDATLNRPRASEDAGPGIPPTDAQEREAEAQPPVEGTSAAPAEEFPSTAVAQSSKTSQPSEVKESKVAVEQTPMQPSEDGRGETVAPESSATQVPAAEPVPTLPEESSAVVAGAAGPLVAPHEDRSKPTPVASPDETHGNASPAPSEKVVAKSPGEESAMPVGAAEKIGNKKTENKKAEQGIFRLGAVNISSPAVKRFELARAVWGNKPRGGLQTIRWNADGVAAVCAFSDVEDRAGGTLYYRWLRDGKQVAKVRVGIGADRWRSYSSKVVTKRMKGKWRVELRDAKGRLLARADFTF